MYARSVKARGRCDRCGFNVLLSELKPEVNNGRRTGLKVCTTCFDPDHPINQRGKLRILDPQSLRDPRPDYDRAASTSYFGWDPIGNPITQLKMAQGDIEVVGAV